MPTVGTEKTSLLGASAVSEYDFEYLIIGGGGSGDPSFRDQRGIAKATC
mgnify:CR=1 FL=1